MTDRIWLTAYPEGIPADIDPDLYPDLLALMDESFAAHGSRVAFRCDGEDLRYAEVDALSRMLAACLQSLGLRKGERIGVMLPNGLHYPVAAAAVLRAGCVLVNINPMYTARELNHQLADSGARALVLADGCVPVWQDAAPGTAVEHIIRCPATWNPARSGSASAPSSASPPDITWSEALHRGREHDWTVPAVNSQDIAVLQYTGGTTGVSKGAMLTHRNLIANLLQFETWNSPVLRLPDAQEQITTVCALPMYHIFAFTVAMMLSMRMGARTLVISNARDLGAMLSAMRGQRFHCLPGVNTLFNGLLNHPDFASVDWSHLRVSVGGGTAIQPSVAQRWLEATGCPIREGYGLTETSPSASANPALNVTFNGTIGVPLPSTDIRLIDDQGQAVPIGQAGEIAIKGPQVMAGYWQRPDETAQSFTADGYLKSGDIGVMDTRGFIRIVDRKKDVILVSGFNVYPNEVEAVVAALPGVRECAVVGVPDAQSGEAVMLVVVPMDGTLQEAAVRAHCSAHLTGYKRPRHVLFAESLPKTAVGKILRRELRRDHASASAAQTAQ